VCEEREHLIPLYHHPRYIFNYQYLTSCGYQLTEVGRGGGPGGVCVCKCVRVKLLLLPVHHSPNVSLTLYIRADHILNTCKEAKVFVSFPLKVPIGKFTGIYFPSGGGAGLPIHMAREVFVGAKKKTSGGLIVFNSSMATGHILLQKGAQSSIPLPQSPICCLLYKGGANLHCCPYLSLCNQCIN
jgi:hypothetical protein